MSLFEGWVNLFGGGRGLGWCQLIFWGGGGGGWVQKRESPDFRSPEVAISADC